MSLRPKETLDAFLNEIITNKEIMNILELPNISKDDNEKNINKKRKLLIDKVITETSQIPSELGKNFPEVEIEGKKYNKYGKTRLTISLAQSIKMDSELFGNPQIDINIYYDNTNTNDSLRLLGLISDLFSGKDLIINVDNNKHMIKQIKCEGITSQVAIINNYERVGIRFSFYATLYKI